MVEATIEQFLRKHALLEKESPFLVAFSGGIDSLTLLYALHKIAQKNLFKIYAIHVNHQWRHEESKQEEAFAISVCNKLNIPIFVDRLDPTLPKTEAVAREKRYDVFEKIADENNLSCLFTGHTKSDQVETILYRLLKGTSPKGIQGIPDHRTHHQRLHIYRPLLSLTRTEIEQYAQHNHLSYAEDSSNTDTTYLRNRIRHSLLPELRTYNNNIEEALLRFSKICEQNESLLEHLLQPTYNTVFSEDGSLKTTVFKELPTYFKPRLLYKFLTNHGIEGEYLLIERLIDNIEATIPQRQGKKFPLIKDLYLQIDQDYIKIVTSAEPKSTNACYQVTLDGKTDFPELDLSLMITPLNDKNDFSGTFPPAESDLAYVDLGNIKEPLYLRTRHPGDRLTPIGMSASTKLKKYLINRRIPQEKKDLLPLLATNSEILWVIGVGISEKIKVTTTPTHVMQVIRR